MKDEIIVYITTIEERRIVIKKVVGEKHIYESPKLHNEEATLQVPSPCTQKKGNPPLNNNRDGA